jgi:hypothetical protein
MAGIDNAELRRNLDPYYLGRNDPWATYSRVNSMYLYLAGLRGFWPMSTISNSVSKDFSPIARHLTATNTPQVGIDEFTPYTQFTSANSEYASVADNADHDITGTETGTQSGIRGLTMGMWVYPDTLAASQGLAGKFLSTGNQRSYRLYYHIGTNKFLFEVSGTGASPTNQVLSSSTASATEWVFLAGRFDPSTEIKIWMSVNGVLETNTSGASIPASIFNSTSSFTIGRDEAGASHMDGRAALCFLSAAYLDDDVIFALFEHTRVLFRI